MRERTAELELQNTVVERQKGEIEELLDESREISRLKSEFLANMSHEIRTPMSGVIGMTQLALATHLDHEQREYIMAVRNCGQALLGVINDILDFSKIEAGRMELAPEPFGLRECIRDALQVFAWSAREKGIELTHTVADDVPDSLCGDEGRLRQILLNLVGNALKFTERGGITVAVTREEMAGSEYNLRFSVADTGMGIPSEKQAVIFEAFAQVDGSTKRRRGGTGLGLAISAKLVALMNGRIWVESEVTKGSTFAFTARFEKTAFAPVSSTARYWTPHPVRPLRVLVAEDNLVNQRLAQRMLEKAGHQAVIASNGQAAVDAVKNEHFDLVLMDLQMPGMDGFEATAAIRQWQAENPEAPIIPIVAMTAHAMDRHREQCLEAGMNGYLSKPVNPSDLLMTIEQVCGFAEDDASLRGQPSF